MIKKKKKKTTAGSDGAREKEEDEENDDFGEVRFFYNYFINTRSSYSWLLLPTSKTNRHKERERKSAGN